MGIGNVSEAGKDKVLISATVDCAAFCVFVCVCAPLAGSREAALGYERQKYSYQNVQ